MTDDELAHAWESFAAALRAVPEMRAARSRQWQHQYASLGQYAAAASCDDAAALNRAMAMRGAPSTTYASNSGLLGLRLF